LKKSIKAVACLFLLTLWLPVLTVYAAQDTSYKYDRNAKPAATVSGADYQRIIDGGSLGLTPFKDVSDVFADGSGQLYITDKGNNRIIITDENGGLLKVLAGYEKNGEHTPFNSPSSVTVDSKGLLLITDTGNKQLLFLNADYSLQRIIPAPVSEIFPKGFEYQPIKAQTDTAGRIFVVSFGFNMGLIELDRSGNFMECLGAPNVAVSPLDLFWRRFSTKAQNERSESFVPTEYNNLTVDEDDFILVTMSSYDSNQYLLGNVNPLRRLNAKGIDVLKKDNSLPPYGDADYKASGFLSGPSKLIDSESLPFGVYSVLDTLRGRVFTYNADGELLFVFGGLGNETGKFDSPVSLAYHNSTFYISDKNKGQIVVYTLSRYGQLLLTAGELHYKGLYKEEEQIWHEIITADNFNPIALFGLGKAAFREKKYDEAIDYFSKTGNKEYYSKVLKVLRREAIRKIFPYTATGIMIAAIAFILLKKLRKKPEKSASVLLARIGYAKYTVFHPFDGFWDIKREKRGGFKAGLIILAGSCLVMVLQSVFTGYLFRGDPLAPVNVFLPVLAVVLPVLLYSSCNWAVAALMDGEGKFSDILTYTSYATAPLIALIPLSILLSNIFILEDGDFYYFIVTFAFIWVLFLIVIGNMQTHYYTMSKNLVVLLITLVVMLLAIFLFMLFFALAQQMFGFVRDVYSEIKYWR